ncbi:MAG: YfiR family protein [Gemmatimonadetes bacterium]|nr:YfiR family protein [Gemmatimonadota bacterium]
MMRRLQSRPGQREKRRLLQLLVCALLCGLLSPLHARRPSEYQVKGLFLSRFAQFVRWPAASFASADDPIVIGIVGRDPFGQVIDQVVAQQTAQNRPLKVKRFKRVRDLEFCHLLFVPDSRTKDLKEILERLQGHPVLTVGESEEFIAEGGCIQFIIADATVRFEIGIESAESAGLKINSRLLDLSQSAREERRKRRR